MKIPKLAGLSAILLLCGCFSEVRVQGTPEEIAARTAALIDKGDTDSAVLELNYLLRRDPDYVPAYCLRANAYAKAQQFPQAIEDYTKVIELSSTTDCGNYGSVFYDRGYSYFISGKPLSAAKDFIQEVKRNPQNGAAYGLMARALRDECFFAKDAGMPNWIRYCARAIDSFDKAYAVSGGSQPFFDKAVVYNQMGYYKNAMSELGKLHAAPGKDIRPADICYETALALYGLQDYQNSVEQFTRAIALDTDNFEYYFRRGLAFSALEDYKSAILDFNTALSYRGGFTAALRARADAAQRQEYALDQIQGGATGSGLK
ncbi:MAG: tetratricopeptide repeat protein [Elusimicrobiaceae bacterium]|nr:tetratricopeptide repeat protein [Elusimicrobiaceae bacterium]